MNIQETTINVIQWLAGDYNHDGLIDGADLDVQRATYGSAVALPGLGADGNLDGVINAADYTVWRDKLAASQSAAIPEPTTLATLVVMASLVATKRSVMRAPWRRA